MKCKIFIKVNPFDIEEEINEWLINNRNISIHHINQSQYRQDEGDRYRDYQNYGTIITIFYMKNGLEKNK